MKKPEFVYIVYYHSYLFGKVISFIDGIFDSKEKAERYIKTVYKNPVYDENEAVWKPVSDKEEFIHIEIKELNKGWMEKWIGIPFDLKS